MGEEDMESSQGRRNVIRQFRVWPLGLGPGPCRADPVWPLSPRSSCAENGNPGWLSGSWGGNHCVGEHGGFPARPSRGVQGAQGGHTPQRCWAQLRATS